VNLLLNCVFWFSFLLSVWGFYCYVPWLKIAFCLQVFDIVLKSVAQSWLTISSFSFGSCFIYFYLASGHVFVKQWEKKKRKKNMNSYRMRIVIHETVNTEEYSSPMQLGRDLISNSASFSSSLGWCALAYMFHVLILVREFHCHILDIVLWVFMM